MELEKCRAGELLGINSLAPEADWKKKKKNPAYS